MPIFLHATVDIASLLTSSIALGHGESAEASERVDQPWQTKEIMVSCRTEDDIPYYLFSGELIGDIL